MTEDMLNWMTPSLGRSASKHLAVAGVGGEPNYTIVTAPDEFWHAKGINGWPWDSFTFDDEYIYQSITELNWAAPTAFKMFASKSWPGNNGAIVWCPRFFTPNTDNEAVITPDSSYRIYTACDVFTTETLGGPIETNIEGPFQIDFGGDLKTQSAMVQTYKYNPGLANQEKNYYVKGYGHVQWELYLLTNGVYVKNQTSAFNTDVVGGAPALTFPCGVPLIS